MFIAHLIFSTQGFRMQVHTLSSKSQLTRSDQNTSLQFGLDFSCVLKSQLIRLLAFTLPFIRDEDVIMTSDVDAFIMTKDILDPLEMYPVQIWLYQYIHTLKLVCTSMIQLLSHTVADVTGPSFML
jgi:hypothetical protein